MKTTVVGIKLFFLIIGVFFFLSCDKATPCKCAERNYWIKNQDKCDKAAFEMGFEQWNKEMENCFPSIVLDQQTEISKEDSSNYKNFTFPKISNANIILWKYRTISDNWIDWSKTDSEFSFNWEKDIITLYAATTIIFKIYDKNNISSNKYYFKAIDNIENKNCEIIIKVSPEINEIVVDIIYINKELVYKGLYLK